MQYSRFFISFMIPMGCLATSIVRLSLQETVAQAQWIVEGDVVRNWCGWDSGHRFIWTHTEIAVRQRWKGSGGATVTVSEPGGEVGGKGMAIAGMVRYTPGEHVLVFLYRTPIGLIRTVGLAQGKLKIDDRGRVHQSLSETAMVSPAGVAQAGSSGSSAAELEGQDLNAVHQRVAGIEARIAAGVQKGTAK